ncbi:MAG: hypothetical protein AB7F43_00835 [Bacteriovoracia bacterium]
MIIYLFIGGFIGFLTWGVSGYIAEKDQKANPKVVASKKYESDEVICEAKNAYDCTPSKE